MNTSTTRPAPAPSRLSAAPKASSIAIALLVVMAGANRVAAAGTPAKVTLLTDFSADLPADESNALIALSFSGIKPIRNAAPGGVTVLLHVRNGKWAEAGHRAAADYHQKTGSRVDPSGLTFDGVALTGTLRMTIEGLPAGPGTKRTPPEDIEATVDVRRLRGRPAPWQEDPTPFMPPWRKEVPRYGGDALTGTFKAVVGKEVSSGNVTGAINVAPVPGVFGPEGNLILSRPEGGGVSILARLAPRRVAAPEGARLVKTFSQPADWRAYSGLRIIIDSPRRRDDAAAGVWVREGGGAWYGATGALPLVGRQITVDVPFADLRRTGGFDDNYFLDLDRIVGIAVGIDEPRGAGDVQFTVRRMELLHNDTARAAQAPVNVTVNPDVVVSINGVDEIPKGLFGFHDVGGNDVKQPDGAPDVLAYTRQLNPGYLRPLDHVGFNAPPITDEQIKAKIESRLASKEKPSSMRFLRAEAGNCIDNIVWCHTVDLFKRPAWMDQDMGKILDGVRAFYRNLAAGAWVPGDDHNLLRRLEVWNEPFMWGRHINMGAKNPPGLKAWEDPTQFGYIPGKLGADVYSDIFKAAVQGARSANRHVLLGGPSAPSFNSDDYSNFENYVRRYIDACHDIIDFLTEHHYQGEPDVYAASYIVAAAYTDTKYGRRIPVFNTEANDLVDTPTKGDDGQPPPWSLKADQLNKAHYNIEDILACIRLCPDIVKGRAMHALWNGYCRNPGETHAYTVLSALRGKVLIADSDDQSILAVASAPAEGSVVVFVFNDSPVERQVRLNMPPGFAPAAFQQLVFDDGTKLVDAPQTVAEHNPAGGLCAFALPSRSAARWTFSKAGHRPSQVRTMETSYADCVLARVKPDAPVSGRVVWRGRGPAGAQRAFLRVISRGADRGEGVAIIRGQGAGEAVVQLPWSSSNDACAAVQDIPIDPACLSAQSTAVEFRCADPSVNNGFTVWAAAIVVQR